LIPAVLTAAGADVLHRTGSAITQQSIGPKVAWLREHEPEVGWQTAAICGPYDFVVRWLTAGAAPVEANWALESGLYDFRVGEWAADICQAAQVDPGWLGQQHTLARLSEAGPEPGAAER